MVFNITDFSQRSDLLDEGKLWDGIEEQIRRDGWNEFTYRDPAWGCLTFDSWEWSRDNEATEVME